MERLQQEAATKIKHVLHNNDIRESTTDNFRLLSKLDENDATTVAARLEKVRTDTRKKWLGLGAEKWEWPCEVQYHPSVDEYSRKTGLPKYSPGHSSIEMESLTGRIVRRGIHMHGEVDKVLVTVLPHEVTHTVLAGNFGTFHVPRWLDEGIAVLEENGTIRDHARSLPGFRKDGTLFTTRELLALDDYPAPKRIGAFYAQSVTLVELLAAHKNGPHGVTKFAQDAVKGDIDAALQRHYGKSVDALHAEWEKHAFAPPAAVGMK